MAAPKCSKFSLEQSCPVTIPNERFKGCQAALDDVGGWSMRNRHNARGLGWVPRLDFSGWNLLPRHGQRRGSRFTRGLAEERLLEPRVSGGTGCDDGRGPPVPRFGTAHGVRCPLADLWDHDSLLQPVSLDVVAMAAP